MSTIHTRASLPASRCPHIVRQLTAAGDRRTHGEQQSPLVGEVSIRGHGRNACCVALTCALAGCGVPQRAQRGSDRGPCRVRRTGGTAPQRGDRESTLGPESGECRRPADRPVGQVDGGCARRAPDEPARVCWPPAHSAATRTLDRNTRPGCGWLVSAAATGHRLSAGAPSPCRRRGCRRSGARGRRWH